MHFDYVKSHPTIATKGAVVALSAAFILELTRTLDTAELELSVLKNSLPSHQPGVCHLADYTDSNQCMLNAFEVVFPGAWGDEEADITDMFVSDLFNDAWKLAAGWLDEAFKEQP